MNTRQMGRWLLFVIWVAAFALVVHGCSSTQVVDTENPTSLSDQTTDLEEANTNQANQPDKSDETIQPEDSKSDRTDTRTEPSVSENEQIGPYIKISPEEANAWLTSDDAPPLLDVRTP